MADIGGYIVVIGVLLGVWALFSLPLWFAAKLLNARKQSFGRAMLATIAGPVVFFITAVAIIGFADLATTGVYKAMGVIIAFIVGFIAWVWVYRKVFAISWGRAFLIALTTSFIFWLVTTWIGAIIPDAPPLNPLTGLESA